MPMPQIAIDECDKDWLGWLNELPSISLAHLREVLRLDAELAAGGAKPPMAVLADQPVRVGNVKLYRPTMGALEYSRETAGWFAADDRLRVAFNAWTLVYARRPQVLCRVHTQRQAETILLEWIKTVGVTTEELADASVAAWQGFPAPVTVTLESDSDLLAWAVQMVQQYGGEVDGWIWHTTAAKAVWLARAQLDQAAETMPGKPGYKAAAMALRALRKRLTAAVQLPTPEASHGQ